MFPLDMPWRGRVVAPGCVLASSSLRPSDSYRPPAVPDAAPGVTRAEHWTPPLAGSVVWFLVFNSFVRDARVLREATTLTAAGYQVTVLATGDASLPQDEDQGGVRVVRLTLLPLHQRVFAKPKPPAPPAPTPAAAGEPATPRAPSPARRLFVRQWRRWIGTPPPAPMKQLRRQLKLRLIAPAQRLRRRVARACRLAARASARAFLLPFARELRYFDYYRRALDTVGTRRCDVVHAHDLNTLPAAWWLARRQRARLVYDSHELYLDRNRRPPRTRTNRLLVRLLERFLVRRCDAVITVNESLASLLAQRYRVPTPVVVMNTPSRRGPQQGAAAPSLRALLAIPPDRRILLYCGFITFHRGLPNLIRSLHHLPDCHVVLMGFGSDRYLAEIDEVVTAEGLVGRCSRIGPVPPEQVPDVAASADLGVAPIENSCLSYYYCAPNKLFEYLHGGLPVIASDFPELAAVIARYRVGATFDPADPRDIARAARQVLDSDPAELAAMRARAREAAGHFSWENESAKLLGVYRELGGGASGSHTAISPGPRLAHAK